MNKDMPEMLNAVIAAKGWTEMEAAKEIGISQPSINRMRKGKTSRISYNVGNKITTLYKRLPVAKR